MSRVICERAIALSNKKKMTIEGRALTKIVGEPCFVDYQSTGIGILRNKVSSEDSV